MSPFLHLVTYAGEAFIVSCGVLVAVVALLFLGGSARWLLTAWFAGLRDQLGIEYEDESNNNEGGGLFR